MSLVSAYRYFGGTHYPQLYRSWFMNREQLAHCCGVTYEDSLISTNSSTSRSPKLSFPFTFPTKTFYVSAISHISPTSLVYFILLNLKSCMITDNNTQYIYNTHLENQKKYRQLQCDRDARTQAHTY